MPNLHSRRRATLLTGGTALALILSATAASARPDDLRAMANRSILNDQSLPEGVIVADGSGTLVHGTSRGNIDRTTIDVSANAVRATGLGNAADLKLTALLDPTGNAAAVTAGPDGVSGDGAAIIASRQSLAAAAAVNGDLVGAKALIRSGSATASRLTLLDNVQDAAATGNDLTASIATQTGGTGIAVGQATLPGSGVAARARGSFRIATGAVQDSEIATSGNLDRATAIGNAATSALLADTPALGTDGSPPVGRAEVAGDGDATTEASLASVTSQSASGIVKAIVVNDAGGAIFSTAIAGDADTATIASDENKLVATAQGNRANTGIDLSATTTATADTTPVASIVTHQTSRDLTLGATTMDGTQVTIDGDATASRLSASRNEALTEATANLSVIGLTADATRLEAAPVPALASVDNAGVSTADGGLSVNSVQDFATSSVRASHIDARTAVAVLGDIDRSTLDASGNVTQVAATGNDADSLARIDGTNLAASIAVNGVQTGNGDVIAQLGTTGAESGIRLVPYGTVTGSTLTVGGNRNLASAIGNISTAAADVTATTISASGASAVSGGNGDGFGATGDVAVASRQRIGEPGGGALLPKIEARAVTGGGIAAQGMVVDSRLAIGDNVQQATAIGNSGANRLTVVATDLGSTEAPAGTALASDQFGRAAISATSQAPLLVRGELHGSTVNVENNRNAALATMNDTDNRLSVDAVSGASTGPVELASTPEGDIEARGDHVLTSRQYASGSVAALATSRISGGGANGSEGSSWRIAGNQVQGEASANRAVNAVTLNVVDGAASAGLANSQINTAETQVSAGGFIGLTVPTTQAAAIGSDINIEANSFSALARGNAADNSVTLAAGTGMSNGDALAAINPSGASVRGGAVLLNAQTNLAPVSAYASDSGFLVPLNAGLDTARVSMTGNSVNASAYGNSATNSMTLSGLGAPAGGITSVQVNLGNVSAMVTEARSAPTRAISPRAILQSPATSSRQRRWAIR